MIALLALIAAQVAPSGPPQPPKADPYARCVCEAAQDAEFVSFEGVVSDSQMTLAEDGRSVNDRQATIFRVLKEVSGDVPDPAKVWHVTDPADCGVSFDYGKRYEVRAQRKGDELETNWCVTPKREKDAD